MEMSLAPWGRSDGCVISKISNWQVRKFPFSNALIIHIHYSSKTVSFHLAIGPNRAILSRPPSIIKFLQVLLLKHLSSSAVRSVCLMLLGEGMKIKHLVAYNSTDFRVFQLSQPLICSYSHFFLLSCTLRKSPDFTCLVHYHIPSP